jgi:hypothetical protein
MSDSSAGIQKQAKENRSMKAVRLVEAHYPLHMQEIPVPIVGESDVLVRVRAAGICHCVMPSDRPMGNFPHRHSGREIGCEPHARLSVTCVRYGSRRAPSRWERWQALQEGRCYFPSLGLVHVCRRPLWFFSRTVAQAQESMCQRREVCRGSGIA